MYLSFRLVIEGRIPSETQLFYILSLKLSLKCLYIQWDLGTKRLCSSFKNKDINIVSVTPVIIETQTL